jgi:hypothetical protein
LYVLKDNRRTIAMRQNEVIAKQIVPKTLGRMIIFYLICQNLINTKGLEHYQANEQ